MKVAYVFISPRAASYKLAQMVLPQLEAGTHGVDVVGMFFFDDNVWSLRKGDPVGERLAKVAQQKGISNGEYVWVRSAAGAVKIKALVTPKIRKDTVFMVHGFGSNSTAQTTSKGRGGADQNVIQSHADVISGNQAMHETWVESSKA